MGDLTKADVAGRHFLLDDGSGSFCRAMTGWLENVWWNFKEAERFLQMDHVVQGMRPSTWHPPSCARKTVCSSAALISLSCHVWFFISMRLFFRTCFCLAGLNVFYESPDSEVLSSWRQWSKVKGGWQWTKPCKWWKTNVLVEQNDQLQWSSGCLESWQSDRQQLFPH